MANAITSLSCFIVIFTSTRLLLRYRDSPSSARAAGAIEDEIDGMAPLSGEPHPTQSDGFHGVGKGKEPMSAEDVVRMEGQREVTQKDRILAASCGAVATVLTMTPFDVVKTRLQTQPALPPTFSPSASTSATLSTCCQKTYFSTNSEGLLCRFDPRQTAAFLPSSGSHRPFSRAAIVAGEALVHSHGSVASLCVYPDPRSAAASLEFTARPAKGLLDALVLIVRQEGFQALWRGVSPALAMSVPAQAVYMVGYDSLRRALYAHAPSYFRTLPQSTATGDGLTTGYRNLLAPLSAGAVSRALVAMLFSPLELFRTRLQAIPSSSSSTAAIVRSTASTVRAEGLTTLWRGLPSTLWRDVPFSAVYWAGYETTRRYLTGGKGLGERATAEDEARGKTTTMVKSFVAGSASGCAAAVVTNPFDVVKTRRQASLSEGTGEWEGTIRTLVKIRQEGALMKGLTPRLAKIVPACGIMIASYEGLAQVLAEL